MAFDRTALAAAAVALAIGFGGGYLVAKGPAPQRAGPAAAPSGFAWALFGKPRGADAPRPAPKKPDGFAVWTTRVDTSGAEPLACVRLTRPLDPRASYGDFVQATPELDHPPAVTARGDELCIAGGGFNGHRFTLLKGLRAADGETLAANADVDFTFGDQPPYVGFAGSGVILPREEADGVGIETANVSKLEVEVTRVPDRNLVRKQITAPDPTPEGGYAEDGGDDGAGDDGQVVWKGVVAVKPASAGAHATTVFPLGAVLKEMKPGAYVVKAVDASGRDAKAVPGDDSDSQPAQARRWILFTDMAMMAYSGSDALDVVVRSLKSAEVMGGVKVALVAKDGEDLASAMTDAQGKARFAHPLLEGQNGSAPKMLMAYGPNADFAALDLDRSPVDLSNAGAGAKPGESVTAGRDAKTAVDAYLYADRGIYRPGETVHLVAMARDHEARAVKDRKGSLVVRRPSGVELARIRFDRLDTGVLARDVAIPAGAPRGHWTASLEVDGIEGPVGQLGFEVQDFAPERLAVTVSADADKPLTAGETRPMEILARFLYGANGSGLDVEAEARIRPDYDPFPALKDYRWGDEQTPYQEKFFQGAKTVTDGAGRAMETFDAAQAGDATAPLLAVVSASVFEPGGRPVRENVTLKLHTKPLYLGVKTGSIGSGDAPTQTFDIVAVNAAGQRVAADGVAWSLISENWDYDWFQKDGRWQWRRTSRDAVIGKGVVSVGTGAPLRLSRQLSWGDYRLELTEPKTGARTVVRLASGWGEPSDGSEPPDAARVSAGTKAYVQGDTVEIAIKAPYAGQAQVAVATDRLIDFRTLTVTKDGGTIKLKTSAAWGGGAYVLVDVVQPRDPAVTPKPRRALGLVYVPLDPKNRKLTVTLGAPAKLDSKAPIQIPVTVQGLPLGGKAHVTVAAVDEGILRLTHQDSPDPVKWYFGKRSLSLDYRDDYGRLLDPNLGAAAQVAYGGDEVGGEGLTVTPIKTVALWSGVVETGPGGKAVVKLPAADFNGQLRLMAVAWTDDAVGSASSDMIVREAVVAELATPRFLAPGDHAFATLELNNVEGKAGAYTAAISGQGGIGATFTKPYQLMLGQRATERTPLDAPAAAGIGRVDLKVTGPAFASETSYPLQTRLGWGAQTRAEVAFQKPGEAYTPPPATLAGMAAGTVSLTVSYSPFQGFDPAPIAEALSRYPYGCTEQIVSASYPLLYAQGLTSDPKLRVAPAVLSDAVSKVLDREAQDGSFGLWRAGDGEADAWLGAFTTDFLVEARARGANVPADAMDRALQAMRLISRPAGFASIGYRLDYPPVWYADPAAAKVATARLRSRAAAYALYVLAKAQSGDIARLRWFHDVQMKDEPSPLARAQVGAGLALMGDRARAHDSFVQAVQALGYKEDGDWYQSPLRDLAGVISLAYQAGETGIAHQLQGRLDGAVKDPDSLNTQEQARLLQAADVMLRAAGPMRIQAGGVRALGPDRWAVGRLADARFVNAGTGGLWRTVTVRGTPTAAPPAAAQGLTLEKRLFTLTGGAVDPAGLTQGSQVIVRLAGTSAQARSMLTVIDDALPAGFEVETVLSPEDAQKGPFKFLGELTAASTQEARDDRFVAALTVPGHKAFAVAYIARAVTPGDFFLPGAEARDMYRPSVVARTAPGRTRIAAGS